MRRRGKISNDIKNILIIVGSIAAIVFLLGYVYVQKSNENFKNIKIDKSKYLVYSIVEEDDSDYPKYVPYVNIKGEYAKEVNKDINDITKDFLKRKNSIVTYDYDINGIILSLVVKIVSDEISYSPEISFRTYNFNLKTKELIDDQSLLDFFGADENLVSNKIEEKFRLYYKELVDEKYYEPSECDYNCFIKYRDIGSYINDVNYYVKDGNLIAYKPFVFYSIFGDEEYFKEEHFEFLIVKTDKN